MNANCDDNECDKNGGDTLDFDAFVDESVRTGKFFAADNYDARNRIDKAVRGIGNNRQRI